MSTQLPNTLKLMQLNAENLFIFTDEEIKKSIDHLSEREWKTISSATTPNKPLVKCRWLAESILDVDPDVIFLNEVGGLESIHNFNKYFLKNSYLPYLIEGNSDRGIDIGYLVHKRLPWRFELITHKNRPLHFLYPHEQQLGLNVSLTPTSQPNDQPAKVIKSHYFSRDCAELRAYPIQARDSGEDSDPRAGASGDSSLDPSFIFFLVHLKSKLDPEGIDPGGKDRRAAELKTLVDIYKESQVEFPHVPKVVAGDFNGFAGKNGCHDEFKLLHQETDLIEVFELAGKPAEERFTQIQFNRMGGNLGLHIDYIFLSKHWHQNIIPEETYVYLYRSDLKVKLPYPKTFDQRLQLPSDHYPVVTALKMPGTFFGSSV